MEFIDTVNLYFTGSTSLLAIYSIFYDITNQELYNIINTIIVLYLIYDIYEKKTQLYFLNYKENKNNVNFNVDYDYENYNKIIRNKEVIIHHIVFLGIICFVTFLKINYFNCLLIESSTFFLTLQKRYNKKIIKTLFKICWIFCRFIYLPYNIYYLVYYRDKHNYISALLLICVNIIYIMGIKWTLELMLEKSQRFYALKCYESIIILSIPQLITLNHPVNIYEYIGIILLTFFSAGKYTLLQTFHKYYLYFDTGQILSIVYFTIIIYLYYLNK